MTMKRLIALTTGLLLFATPIANAHTALVSATPKNNAMLHKSPAAITLTFNEALIKISGQNPSKISLTNSKGVAITLPEPTIQKSTITKCLGQGKD